MAEIADYIKAVFYRDYPHFLKMPEGYVRRDDIVPCIEKALTGVTEQFKANELVDLAPIAEAMFDEWRRMGILVTQGDQFAGLYFKFSQNQLNISRANRLDRSEIHARSQAIGSRFYQDVFSGYKGLSPLTTEEYRTFAVPASDRIVTLNHNQADQLEHPIAEFIEQVEHDNGIPDKDGLKEQLLGQVKAGRELIRSGNFKAYLLYVTIIKALSELIHHYQGSAVAMVAASLVDLLVKKALQVE